MDFYANYEDSLYVIPYVMYRYHALETKMLCVARKTITKLSAYVKFVIGFVTAANFGQIYILRKTKT
jgi:hypothetical protein